MEVHEKIKKRREELGMSQRDLCQKMGYSNHSMIAHIEKGKVNIPHSRLVQFAKVLGVPLEYLISAEEIHRQNDTLADIILALRSDAELADTISKIIRLDPEDRLELLAMADKLICLYLKNKK